MSLPCPAKSLGFLTHLWTFAEHLRKPQAGDVMIKPLSHHPVAHRAERRSPG